MGVTAAAASMGGSIIGSGLKAAGAMQAGAAQATSSNYQAQIAENNAIVSQNNAELARRNAVYAEQSGGTQERNNAVRGRAAIGQQTAQAAANSVDVGSGSVVDITDSTARIMAESGQNIRDSTARQVAGFRIQGLNYDNEAQNNKTQAGLYRAQGKSAMAAAKISALTSLVGGATNAYGTFADMQATGTPFFSTSVQGAR